MKSEAERSRRRSKTGRKTSETTKTKQTWMFMCCAYLNTAQVVRLNWFCLLEQFFISLTPMYTCDKEPAHTARRLLGRSLRESASQCTKFESHFLKVNHVCTVIVTVNLRLIQRHDNECLNVVMLELHLPQPRQPRWYLFIETRTGKKIILKSNLFLIVTWHLSQVSSLGLRWNLLSGVLNDKCD